MYPSVSYSALERWEACSMRHQLHVARKRTEIAPEFVLVGNALHYGMAVYLDTAGAVSLVQAAVWEFERRLRQERPSWTREKVVEQLERVREGASTTEDLLSVLAKTEGDPKLRSEVRLLRAYRGWAIDGYIDLLISNGREVWDLKTGKWHSDQLVFYDILVSSVLGVVPETAGIIEPFGRGLVPVEVSDEHRVDMKRRIQTFVHRVTAEDWQFEGYKEKCGWCRCKPWCPRWDAARQGSFSTGA